MSALARSRTILIMRTLVAALSTLATLAALAVPLGMSAALADAPTSIGWFHAGTARTLFQGQVGTSAHTLSALGHAGIPNSGVRAVDVRLNADSATKSTSVRVNRTSATPRAVLAIAKGTSASTTATVSLGSDGKLQLRTGSGTVRVKVTVLGWFGGSSGAGFAVAHGGVVANAVTVKPGHPRWLAVAGKGVTVLSAQVVATAGTHAATLTLPTAAFPIGKHKSTTAALDLPLGTGAHAGKVHVSAAHGPVTVSIAALGQYAAASTQALNPVSMSTLTASKALTAGATATVAVAGHAGVPKTGASAVVVSITGASASKATALTVFGGADHRPSLATLSVAKGSSAAGWAVVPLGRGAIKVYNKTGRVGVHLAVQGWFGKVTAPTSQPAGPPDSQTLAGLTAGAGSPSTLAEPQVTGRDVTYTLGAATTITKTVGAAGGTLSETLSDGRTLTLDIPAGALAFETTVRATAIVDMAGASAVGASVYGMQLEPSGLVLMKPATLTVVPPGGVQSRAAIGAEAADDGSLTHPTWLLPDATSFSEPVDHFSDHTILIANSDSGFTGQYFTSAEYTANIQGKIAQVTEQAREAARNDQSYDLGSHLEPVMDEYYNQVVAPIVQAAGGSCDSYEAGYATALSYERTRDMLGMTNQQQSNAITTGMVAGLQNCWQERTKDCMTMDPERWGELLWIARQMQILGIERAGGGTADPYDSNQVRWCSPVNGYITITDTRNRTQDQTGPTIRESNSYTYWITGEYTLTRQSGGGYAIAFTDKGSRLTLAYSLLRMRLYNETCLNMAKAALNLDDASMAVTGRQTFNSSGVTQTNAGWSAPNAHWTVPETITDPCAPPSPESVNLTADIDLFTHTEQIDKADELYLLSGTRDIVESGANVHQTITGRLHMTNLAKVLP